MSDLIFVRRRVTVIFGDGPTHQVIGGTEELREKSLMRCVYLTHSIAQAVHLQRIVKGVAIRVHRAATLAEAQILLQITGARVMLVDLHFWGRNLRRLFDSFHLTSPQSAVVVVAPEVDAGQWEEVLCEGGFDTVLYPFSREELAVVMHDADEYAAQHLTDDARAARLTGIRSAIRAHAKLNSDKTGQEISPFRTA